MIKKCKVVMCDFCDAIAKMKLYVDTDDTYEVLPKGWHEGPSNKTHLCPTCKKLFDVRKNSMDSDSYDLKASTITNDELLRNIRKFANETWIDMKQRITKLENEMEENK